MNFAKNLPASISRRFALFLLISFGAVSGALAQGPAGDLTITVQELENGDVEYSLSGSTTYKQVSGYPSRTPGNTETMEPPHTLDDYEYYDIPEGLIFTVPNNVPINDDEPEPLTREAPLRYLEFNSSGYWSFYSFSTGELFQGDEIAGSGSVITDEVPFENFVPGVYTVIGGEFDMTYIVRAYSTAPELKVPARNRFPATRVRRTSRSSRIVIRNVGDGDVENLTVRISGSASRDFRIRTNPSSMISSGQSTVMRATFRPRAAGNRRAIVSLMSNAPTSRIRFFGRGIRTQGPIIPPRSSNRPLSSLSILCGPLLAEVVSEN